MEQTGLKWTEHVVSFPPGISVSMCSCSVMSDSCSPTGSSVHRIFQARMLEWVITASSRDLPDPRIKLVSPASHALAGRFFTTEPLGKPLTHRFTHCCELNCVPQNSHAEALTRADHHP